MSETDSGTRVLRVFGCASIVLYFALAAFFWTYWSFRKNPIDEVVMVVVTGALVAMYFAGLKFARQAKTVTIVIFAIAFGILGFVMPPFDSTDVFFYMAIGWQQSHYGGNPYSGVLRNVDGALDDPMIQNDWMVRNRNPWLDIPVPYGFLFSLLARALAWLGKGSFWATLVLFGCFNLLLHGAIGWLLWRAGRLLKDGNGQVLLYLYSWNPFVILQYLGDLHNDIVVAFFILLAAYCLLKNRPVWSLPLVIAAGLIKYVALALVPFTLLFMIRQRRWKEAAYALTLSVLLILVTAAPYVTELSAFQYRLIWAQLSESSGSLHAFMTYSYRALSRAWPPLANSVADFGILTQAGLWLLFAIFVGWELHVSWLETDGAQGMIQRWSAILFALIFVASSQFYAWYIGMLFPLALLTHRKTILADCVIALSGAHLLSFTLLRRKAIGYFVVATLLPLLYLLAKKRSQRRQLAPTN